jgi:hypothetical protein
VKNQSSLSLRTRLFLVGLSFPAMVTGCQNSGSILQSKETCAIAHSRNSGSSPSGSSGDMNGGSSPIGGNVQQCRGNSDECKRPNDFDRAAIPAPPGTYVLQWSEAMICSARRTHLIVSRHEWFSGGSELGPEGREHVLALATRLAGSVDNVLIEPEPVQLGDEETLEDAMARTSQTNEDRRTVVVQLLTESGLTDADQRVFLVPLEVVGVHGIEAPLIYNRLLFGGQGGGQGGNQNSGGNMGGGQGGGAFGGGGGMF